MKFQVMIEWGCRILMEGDCYEGAVREYQDRFQDEEERNFTVLDIVDEYYSEEMGAGYTIYEVEAEKAEDIKVYMGDTLYSMTEDYIEGELITGWIPEN